MGFRILDAFCKAGGAGMGYHRAGFDVVGIDIEPQQRYPFEFHQGDAFEFILEHGHEFDAIHVSPPCQKYTRMSTGLLKSQGRDKNHPGLIEPVRELLIKTGKPYVIENVPGAPLRKPVILCGSSFGLLVQRHRLFECSFFVMVPECIHGRYVKDKPPLHRLVGKSRVVGCYGHGRGKGDDKALWSRAMGIEWMTREELSQAIPPAYTEWIGRQLMQKIKGAAKERGCA
ncbi:MAG: hypothetical protein WAW37_12955 [Syntrophobacteraceae bacterium]